MSWSEWFFVTPHGRQHVETAVLAIAGSMELPPDYAPNYDELRDLLLAIAPERSVQELLAKVVTSLAARPHVVLAAIWLIEKGDACRDCIRRPDCPNQSRCLHLAARAVSAEPQARRVEDHLSVALRRGPLSIGTVGRVAATAQPIVSDTRQQPEWLDEWREHPEVQGLDAQPIGYKGQVLGVLLLLTRIPTPPLSPVWVRIFADHLGAVIMNARSFEEIEALKTRLELENSYLREEIRESKTPGGLIGQSLPVNRLLQQIEMVARTDATVLVCGESGAGKELVAREIHRRSRRSSRPLIQVNCASIPRDLFESEFFGHVKGAFTGALRDRAGRFEAAGGGTLFLDEVGEIPLELQSKLLRVLQEKRYERVGEEQTRTVDVRIIAATNRDLRKAVQSGQFRQDLYYRLNVFPLQVAPLRERRDDVPLLARQFLADSARKLGLPAKALAPEQERQLRCYDWPGNVRELQNVIERALILAQAGPLHFDLPPGRNNTGSGLADGAPQMIKDEILSDSEFRERERLNMMAALTAARWKIHGPDGAAELLGLKPTTLISRMKKLGMAKPAKEAI